FYHVTRAGVTLHPQQLREPPPCHQPSSIDSRRADQLHPKRRPRSTPRRSSSTGFSNIGTNQPSAEGISLTTDPALSETNKAQSTRPKPWNGTDGSSPPQHTGTIGVCGKSFGRMLFAQLSQSSKIFRISLGIHFLSFLALAKFPKKLPGVFFTTGD